MANLLSTSPELISRESISRFDEGGHPHVHNVECELLSPPPRMAHLTNGTILTRRIFWNVLLAIVVFSIYFGRRDLESWDDLMLRGIIIQGHVTGKYETSNKGHHNYHLEYAFHTDDADCSGTMSVSYPIYQSTVYGQSLPLTYLPGSQGSVWREGHVTPAGRADRQAAWIFGPLLMFGVVAGIFALCNAGWNNELRLLQSGIAVVGCTESGTVIRGKSVSYQIKYRYPTGAGTSQVGSTYVDAGTYQRYTERNPMLTILYDPTRESRHLPYFQIKAARLDSIDAPGMNSSSSVMPS